MTFQMHSKGLCRVLARSVLAAAVCMFVMAAPAESADRELFKASYLLSDINEAESEVSVQLTVSLTDHSAGE